MSQYNTMQLCDEIRFDISETSQDFYEVS